MPHSRFHGVFGPLLGGMGSTHSTGSGQARSPREVSIKEEEGKGGLPADLSAEARRAKEEAPQGGAKAGQVALDIYEEDGYLIIKAPIAGVKLSDIDIDVVDNVITIHGKREQCDELTDDQYYLQECYWGEFSRSVTLPFVVNPSRVKATFSKDNILKIYVPKEERKIKIVKINEGG